MGLLLVGTACAQKAPRLPYAQAGLTPRQAAAFLLSRLTFGCQPGEVDGVVGEGLERWTAEQLDGSLSEELLDEKLKLYGSLALAPQALRSRYIPRKTLVERAEKDGLPAPKDPNDDQKKAYESGLRDYKKAHDLLTVDDEWNELRGQKLVRLRYARNQLREVLTDFWLNHFNVVAQDDRSRLDLMSYERDLLRPGALGRFEVLLQETARHPAMLTYLNNRDSSAAPEVPTTLNRRFDALTPGDQKLLRPGQPLQRKKGGLNENYAREVMELHTLGVDGGYTQRDVTELARVLSGWSVLQPEADQPKLQQQVSVAQLGYLREGDFVFRADWHDAGEKMLLGRRFPAGGEEDEGRRALDMLARHPNTARLLCRELAQRFVCDEPPASLVDRLVKAWTASSGQTRSVMQSLVESPEFWAEARKPSKVKSPLEFFVSAIRAAGADYAADSNHYNWLNKMGEPLYGCVPPTGYGENSARWAAGGALLSRIELADKLSRNGVPRVKANWDALAGPATEPVWTLAATLMPERKLDLGGFRTDRVDEPQPETAAPSGFKRRQELIQKVAATLLASPSFQLR